MVALTKKRKVIRPFTHISSSRIWWNISPNSTYNTLVKRKFFWVTVFYIGVGRMTTTSW